MDTIFIYKSLLQRGQATGREKSVAENAHWSMHSKWNLPIITMDRFHALMPQVLLPPPFYFFFKKGHIHVFIVNFQYLCLHGVILRISPCSYSPRHILQLVELLSVWLAKIFSRSCATSSSFSLGALVFELMPTLVKAAMSSLGLSSCSFWGSKYSSVGIFCFRRFHFKWINVFGSDRDGNQIQSNRCQHYTWILRAMSSSFWELFLLALVAFPCSHVCQKDVRPLIGDEPWKRNSLPNELCCKTLDRYPTTLLKHSVVSLRALFNTCSISISWGDLFLFLASWYFCWKQVEKAPVRKNNVMWLLFWEQSSSQNFRLARHSTVLASHHA